jgi:prophage antirepressor-like protein
MATLIDLYNGLLKYDNNDIIIVIDDTNMIWFYGRQVAKFLEYKNPKNAIGRLNPKNKKPYSDIKKFSQYNVQDHTIFINEYALIELAIKSKMPKAVKFTDWITSEVIPTIRKTGKYEVDDNTAKKIDDMNEELKKYKKRVKVLENNQKKEKYVEGGYIYVIKNPESDEANYKIGKTDKDLNKRLNTYNTSSPDNFLVAYKKKVDLPIAVEHCLKGILYRYRYRNKKEYYKIGLKQIIKMIDYSNDLANGKRINLSRSVIEQNESNDMNVYGIMIIDTENENQYGGQKENFDISNMYKENKYKYTHMRFI